MAPGRNAVAPGASTKVGLSQGFERPYHRLVMRMLSTLLFLVTGVVNLLPVSGLLSKSRLQALYGVVLEDPNLIILMRHRAGLFGIVGSLLVASAFHTPLRPLALAAGLMSMLSFVVIAYLVGDYNAELRRVVVVDLVASALLVGAWLATGWSRMRDSAA